MKVSYKEVLEIWINNEFKKDLLDDEKVMEAAAMLKVALEKGDDSLEAIRKCIAVFVIDSVASLPE